jgi:CBS domain-containing protein
MEGQSARDVMTTDVVMLDERSTVGEAARRMREMNVGDVLVGHDGIVSAIVTDRDIVIRAVASGFHPDETTLAEIALEGVVTVEVDDDIETIREALESSDIRRVPVVDGDKVVGIISRSDLGMTT